MTDRDHYAPSAASIAPFCQPWSVHVDALERHLSAKTWALGALSLVLIAYPVVRFVLPFILHGIVPDVVRTVLNLI